MAGQTSTVDNLSNGRVTLAVGLGVSREERFWLFEDDPGRKVRAELMDESLEMLRYLWRDEPFEFAGKHYRSKKIADLMPLGADVGSDEDSPADRTSARSLPRMSGRDGRTPRPSQLRHRFIRTRQERLGPRL